MKPLTASAAISAVLSLIFLLMTAPKTHAAESSIMNSAPAENFIDVTPYFKNTYEEADQSFDELFTKIKSQHPQAEVFNFLYPHGKIKSYFIPATAEAHNLLIMISGTHGIEGHAGSAVQRYWLSKNLALKNTSILMIHGFNLWGFKNSRRANENNVDLNRAFIIDRNRFDPDDSAYTQLNSFLNPTTPASHGLVARTLFYVQAIRNILQYSVENLRASILKGQYTFPQGLFFGGKDPQEQELMIEQLSRRYIKDYKKVFLIDLHTGYGERNKLHLLAGRGQDPNSIALRKVFAESDIDFSDKKKFYAINGDMGTYFVNTISVQNPKTEVIGITFEYGTLDSQKLFGSLESLRRMLFENQNFHYPGPVEDSNSIKNEYREMFYPSDNIWRTSILKQTDERMKDVLKYLENK